MHSLRAWVYTKYIYIHMTNNNIACILQNIDMLIPNMQCIEVIYVLHEYCTCHIDFLTKFSTSAFFYRRSSQLHMSNLI